MTEAETSFRILNIRGLVADFQQKRIGEDLGFRYLLAEFLFLMLGGALSVQLPPEDGVTWLLTTSLLLVAVGLGTVYSYQKNQEGDGVDFVTRYIAVNFVVSMCFLVAYICIVFALAIFYPLLEDTGFMSVLGVNLMFNTVVMAVVLWLYYYMIARYIRQIATHHPETPSSHNQIEKP